MEREIKSAYNSAYQKAGVSCFGRRKSVYLKCGFSNEAQWL